MSNKKYIWVNTNRFNSDSEKYPYRNKIKSFFNEEFVVDRFNVAPGLLELSCVNIVKDPKFNLVNLSKDFEERYYSLFDQVANNIFEIAKDKTIHIFYSGGIDSVCVLIALLKNKKYKEFLEQNRFFISMTQKSVEEYPYFFHNFIQDKIPIRVLNFNKVMNDPNILIVSGDSGDFIIGSSDSLNFNISDLMESWQKLNVNEDLYLAAVKKCPFDITSINQYFWWINQCFSYQDELIRYYVWSTTKQIQTIPTDEKVFRFFYDDLFTTFSYEYMSTNPVYHDSKNLKTFAKKYIFDFTKDSNYLNKEKICSQKMIGKRFQKNSIFIEDNIIKSD